MFPLYNTVFDIIASVDVCVDFLGTHMASLVLFFKTGCDTSSSRSTNSCIKNGFLDYGALGTNYAPILHQN